MYSLDIFNKNIVTPFLSQKYLLFNLPLQFSFRKIVLSLSFNNLNSDEDPVILEAIRYLENISLQKVYIKKSGYQYVGSKKVYRISLLVTLRDKRLYDFLLYCYFVLFPTYKRKEGILSSFLIEEGIFTMCLHEFSFFFNLKQGINQGKLHISFVGNDLLLDKKICKDFLIFFGFPI